MERVKSPPSSKTLVTPFGTDSVSPSVRLGSYPRFSERAFRVMVTLEGRDGAAVAAAYAALAERLGALVVKREEPARVGG